MAGLGSHPAAFADGRVATRKRKVCEITTVSLDRVLAQHAVPLLPCLIFADHHWSLATLSLWTWAYCVALSPLSCQRAISAVQSERDRRGPLPTPTSEFVFRMLPA
jgi:hypothetical protein